MGKDTATAKTGQAKAAAKETAAVLEKCLAQGCKTGSKVFGFCEEHYDHFKFGLIKRTGEPVSDYDKKYGHYAAWKEKSVAVRKAA